MNLVEVMISLVIASVVVLGCGHAQMQAYHIQRSSYYQAVAATELYSLQELYQLYAISTLEQAEELELAVKKWSDSLTNQLPSAKITFQQNDAEKQVAISWHTGTLAQPVFSQ